MIVDEKKAKEAILRGLPTIIRIAEKLWPENHDPDHLEKASNALDEGVEDPLHILKQAGIDIEPELEEFRQFLAEISGKKRKAKSGKSSRAGTKTGHALTSPDLAKAKLEVLSILQALEFTDHSEEAKKKAIKKLSAKIKELSENEPFPELLTKIGFYAYTIELIKRAEWKKAEKLKEL